MSVLEKVSLASKEWPNYAIVASLEALYIFGIDCCRRGYFKDPKGYQCAFGVAAMVTEIKQLSTTA